MAKTTCKTLASAYRDLIVVYLTNCVGGREPNTSTIFVKPL